MTFLLKIFYNHLLESIILKIITLAAMVSALKALKLAKNRNIIKNNKSNAS